MGGWDGTARPAESGGAEGSAIQGTGGWVTSVKARSVTPRVGARGTPGVHLVDSRWKARRAPSSGLGEGPPSRVKDGGRGPQVQGGELQVGLVS